MKDIVAFLVFMSLATITIFLAVTKQINSKLCVIFLVFSLLSGLAISNYDLVDKFKWSTFEVQTARRTITQEKEKALDQIRSEVDEQKQSIKLLLTNANDTRERVDDQKRIVESLLEVVKKTERKIQNDQRVLEALNSRAEETKNNIEVLHKASSDLALLLAKITWLQIETKSEFGTDRAQAAIQRIVDDLNRIVDVVIPDRHQKSQWISELQKSLPPRK